MHWHVDPAELLVATLLVWLIGALALGAAAITGLLLLCLWASEPRDGDVYVSNCVLFALRRWMRRGGYLIVRRSRLGPYPHLLWSPDVTGARIEQFVPTDPAKPWFLVFRGQVQAGRVDSVKTEST